MGIMAADISSEISSSVSSPRISFSYDLNETEESLPAECCHRRSDALLLDFSTDFDFCISVNNFHQDNLSADELFSDGKILPTQIKKVKSITKDDSGTHRSQPCTTSRVGLRSGNVNDDSKKKRLKEFLFESIEEDKPASKSFWHFKRSTSLNCEKNRRNKGLIGSLQVLGRSNSTGSAPNPKQSMASKANPKEHLQKQRSLGSRNRSLPSYGEYHQIYNSSGRPPLLKKCKSYGSGVRINPVLNITPAYLSKGTSNLFGFGSFFCNGKSKKKKK
ncbi:hypothetical protein ACET3Z_032012 [Daucus carota]